MYRGIAFASTTALAFGVGYVLGYRSGIGRRTDAMQKLEQQL